MCFICACDTKEVPNIVSEYQISKEYKFKKYKMISDFKIRIELKWHQLINCS
jgi:hypothetical protein